ncbi:MAG: hypothetical protein ABL931_22105, partial [Usitatibacteraceae bacterium]
MNAPVGMNRSNAKTVVETRSKAGFRLLRYFTITSLIAFSCVGIAIFVLERREEAFFEKVQAEQTAFFSKAQADLSRQQEETARTELCTANSSVRA